MKGMDMFMQNQGGYSKKILTRFDRIKGKGE